VNSRALNQELLTGLVLLAGGTAGWFFGEMETSSGIDAAGNFFPRAVFVGLMVIGSAIAVRGLITARERVATIPLRSCVAVTASVLAFAALIDKAGLAAAVVITVMLSTLGTRSPRLWIGFVFGICLAAAMFVLFVGLLGQPIRLAPGF
jgi:hypothetical protein